MQFYVDESFQTVGGSKVGALGAVAIPGASYNRFCGAVFGIKRAILGATELSERELKGNSCFSRSLFRLSESGQVPLLFQVVDQLILALEQAGAVVIARWTDRPEMLSLRNTGANSLTAPYVEILRDFAYVQRKLGTSARGSINLDQLGHKEDLHAACTIQNFIARTTAGRYLQSKLLQIPNYTHSAVSPGLQVADLVAYLAAHRTDPAHRPELQPWWDRFSALQVPTAETRNGGRSRLTVRPASIFPLSAAKAGPAVPCGT